MKRGLRRQLRAQRNALSATLRANCAERASLFLIDHSIWQSAQVVASYLPHQSEFDPTVIARRAIAAPLASASGSASCARARASRSSTCADVDAKSIARTATPNFPCPKRTTVHVERREQEAPQRTTQEN